MEDPQSSWNTADIAEVDTTIDHLIEYGIQHRQIAPAYNFDDPDPTAFTQDWCIEEPIEMPQEGPFGTIGLRRVLNKSQAKSQMLRQKLKALAKNRLLQERVILELRRRLLVSGTSKEQVNETDNHLPTLTQMYYNTKNPPSKLAKVIEVRVVTGLPGTLSTANPTTLKLPIDVSFKNVVRTLLKDCVSTELICSAGSGLSNKELDQILEKWRYQLLKKNDKGKLRFEDLSYTQLVLDDDYRNMVKKVIGQGQQIMIPLLTPVLIWAYPTEEINVSLIGCRLIRYDP